MLIRENSKIVLPTGLKKEYNSYPQTYVKTFGLTYLQQLTHVRQMHNIVLSRYIIDENHHGESNSGHCPY